MKLTWKVRQGEFTDLAFDPSASTLLAIQNLSDVPVQVRPNWQTPEVAYDLKPHCGMVLRLGETLAQLGATAGPAHGELWVVATDRAGSRGAS